MCQRFVHLEATDAPIRALSMLFCRHVFGLTVFHGIAVAPFLGSILADVLFYAVIWSGVRLWFRQGAAAAVILALVAWPAFGQVTSVGVEGKGGVDLFVPSWSWYPSSEGSTHTADALLIWGLTNKLDFMVGSALNAGLGQRQWAVEPGFQYQLASRGSWRILTLNRAIVPVTNRSAGSAVMYLSLTADKDLDLLGKKLTVYGGYGPAVPLARGPDRLFSYGRVTSSFPIGIMIPLGAKTQVFFEFALGLRYYSAATSYNVKEAMR